VLLNESGMQNHPLTPMTDANLVRVMQAQTRRKVGLIDYGAVAQGADAVRQRMADLKAQGVEIGKSLVEDDLLGTAKELLSYAKQKGVVMYLPAKAKSLGVKGGNSGKSAKLSRAGKRK